jgi:hypothetical protein
MLQSNSVLLAQTELFNQITVALNILSHKISQQPSSSTDHLYQTALGVKIVPVVDHMAGQLVYPLRKDGYLDFCRARVAFMKGELLYCFLSFFFLQIQLPLCNGYVFT